MNERYKPKPINRFESTLLSITDLSHEDKEFVFSVPDEFTFTAGQFSSILFETPERPIRRPYSIASAPFQTDNGEDGKKTIKLVVKKVEGGAATTYLWKQNVGDVTRMIGPMGVFVLKPAEIEGPLTFIGVGTGMAPFKSMIEELLNNGFTHPIHFIAGYKYEKTMLYDSFFRKLAETYDNFTYNCCISRDNEDLSEEYIKGRVTVGVDTLVKADLHTHYYLCGLYDMIKTTKEQLLEKGVELKQIHFERYD